jgi:phytol kinase
MLPLILTIIAGPVILLTNEIWWRIKKPNDEISRKAVHIIVGCFVAFWPYYLSWTTIEILGLACFVVVYLSKQLKIFRAINSVQRPTWGELFFALSVTVIALITHDRLVYMTAILFMGLADGLAAIFGSYFGKSTSYSIFGNTKSAVGSLTFYVVALLLLANYGAHISHQDQGSVYLLIALSATALENLSVFGLDNLLVPLLIALWLR